MCLKLKKMQEYIQTLEFNRQSYQKKKNSDRICVIIIEPVDISYL